MAAAARHARGPAITLARRCSWITCVFFVAATVTQFYLPPTHFLAVSFTTRALRRCYCTVPLGCEPYAFPATFRLLPRPRTHYPHLPYALRLKDGFFARAFISWHVHPPTCRNILFLYALLLWGLALAWKDLAFGTARNFHTAETAATGTPPKTILPHPPTDITMTGYLANAVGGLHHT